MLATSSPHQQRSAMADFLLKRFLKFVLKRSVGQFLQTELDLEQLDVQLGKGTLEATCCCTATISTSTW